MCSYTRDNLLFNYDYKMDLLKTALERDRIFLTKKVRQDTEESDDDGYFEKAPEDQELIQEMPEKRSGAKDKKKAVEFTVTPVPVEEEEQVEFPDELPNQFGFANFAKMGQDDRA